MAYIGLLIDSTYVKAVCGRASAELHITLAHIPERILPAEALLDALGAYAAQQPPRALALGDTRYFSDVIVRLVAGSELSGMRTELLALLAAHRVTYSTEYEPWVPHCSIGHLDLPYRTLQQRVAHPLAVHVSSLLLAGLAGGVVAHRWRLGVPA